ncbi:MAG: glycosyltransferase family 4 protein [Opitutales bacterium]|nr:glycosyltransferase family 4 protein [Opitutales bacterium]
MLTQVFPPDPAAVGQYFEEAALSLAENHHTVLVLTADRDYDNPKIRYDNRSRHPNIVIKRLPFSSFGKKTILHRLLGQASFLGQSFLRLLWARQVDRLVVTTIPATTGIILALLSFIRSFHIIYWVMDINPDQAVALRIVTPNSLSRRLLDAVNRRLLHKAHRVIPLDTYMAERLRRKVSDPSRFDTKLTIIPPWPLEGILSSHPSSSPNLSSPAPALNEFRQAHGIEPETFVFMYAGNHSLVHPIEAIIEAIGGTLNWGDTLFAFIGGGRGKAAVEKWEKQPGAHPLLNLPYQPLDQVPAMISAADVHLVAMGEAMVGIVHPCKIYSALAAARPILLYGPRHSPLGEMIEQYHLGWVIEPGTPARNIRTQLQKIRETPRDELKQIGQRCREAVHSHYNPQSLRMQFVQEVE